LAAVAFISFVLEVRGEPTRGETPCGRKALLVGILATLLVPTTLLPTLVLVRVVLVLVAVDGG
jgi:hypothetical protein